MGGCCRRTPVNLSCNSASRSSRTRGKADASLTLSAIGDPQPYDGEHQADNFALLSSARC